MRGGIACGIARSVLIWEPQMHHPPKSLRILYYGRNSAVILHEKITKYRHRKLDWSFKTVFPEEDLDRFKYENRKQTFNFILRHSVWQSNQWQSFKNGAVVWPALEWSSQTLTLKHRTISLENTEQSSISFFLFFPCETINIIKILKDQISYFTL